MDVLLGAVGGFAIGLKALPWIHYHWGWGRARDAVFVVPIAVVLMSAMTFVSGNWQNALIGMAFGWFISGFTESVNT